MSSRDFNPSAVADGVQVGSFSRNGFVYILRTEPASGNAAEKLFADSYDAAGTLVSSIQIMLPIGSGGIYTIASNEPFVDIFGQYSDEQRPHMMISTFSGGQTTLRAYSLALTNSRITGTSFIFQDTNLGFFQSDDAIFDDFPATKPTFVYTTISNVSLTVSDGVTRTVSSDCALDAFATHAKRNFDSDNSGNYKDYFYTIYETRSSQGDDNIIRIAVSEGSPTSTPLVGTLSFKSYFKTEIKSLRAESFGDSMLLLRQIEEGPSVRLVIDNFKDEPGHQIINDIDIGIVRASDFIIDPSTGRGFIVYVTGATLHWRELNFKDNGELVLGADDTAAVNHDNGRPLRLAITEDHRLIINTEHYKDGVFIHDTITADFNTEAFNDFSVRSGSALGTDFSDSFIISGPESRVYGNKGDDEFALSNESNIVDTYVDGGLGFDSLKFGNDSVTATINENWSSNQSQGRMVGIESLIGGNGEDNFYGTSTTNDYLNGGSGADNLTGYGGNDTYYVDNSADRVNEVVGGGASDHIITSVSYTFVSGQDIEFLSIADIGSRTNINLVGNDKSQTFFGNSGANKIDGRAGVDTMIGYSGSDTYIIDNSGDKVVEARTGGSLDQARTSVSYTLAKAQEIELLGASNVSSAAALTLIGNETAQRVYGNNGANTLDGKEGADLLRGYGGKDNFHFTTKLSSTNVDRILDFSAAEDTIRLENAIFKALTKTGTLGKDAFKDLGAKGAAVDDTDRVLYNSKTGVLAYDADGNGSAAAITFARIDKHPTLTFQDFQVI